MRRFGERFLHIDMDAFFVEVERKHDSRLVGRPVVVGGLGRRGVVASASYEARARGVQSAMPIGEAQRLCPNAEFIAPSHGRYGEVSEEVFAVFRTFTHLVEGLSVDEAFLDISGLRLHYESPAAVGEALRQRVREDVGLPSSVGVSAVKFISKLASDAAKPDGMLVVPEGDELAFLHPMDVRRLWGVGEATKVSLEAIGIRTVGELNDAPRPVLERRLGPSLAQHLGQLAAGVDPRRVEPDSSTKSISVEETYSEDLDDDEDIEHNLLRLCDRVASRLHRAGYTGRIVTLKVRFGDFETITRSATAGDELSAVTTIWDHVQLLLGKVDRGGRGVRLLGVGVARLSDAAEPRQLSLDDRPRDSAASVVEEVRDRFGDASVFRASFIPPQSQKRRDE